MIQAAGTALIAFSAVLAALFCALYHLSARWWQTQEGRHLMVFTATIAVVLTLWTVGALTQAHGQWWQLLRLVTFAGVPVCLGWRLRLLWHRQIRPALRRPR